ncbi:hypothetical protein N7468_005629 [Penicillium chermesinum]|uniref:Uncharacterized protein n=1 Tax=Penicillium chermesinum TaxID=63820 RepID=A0A9W9TNK7_9EURO|nr:uncharacterized protein N7468_005629 [Penicillium chermesinum]KAJ5232673.1 hypothetical protein N7468_005629 [Penicillium chermesinum]
MVHVGCHNHTECFGEVSTAYLEGYDLNNAGLLGALHVEDRHKSKPKLQHSGFPWRAAGNTTKAGMQLGLLVDDPDFHQAPMTCMETRRIDRRARWASGGPRAHGMAIPFVPTLARTGMYEHCSQGIGKLAVGKILPPSSTLLVGEFEIWAFSRGRPPTRFTVLIQSFPAGPFLAWLRVSELQLWLNAG